MQYQVQEFIQRRFDKNCHWQDENSFYFATMLKVRFPELSIYYLPVQGHFVAGHNDIYYDSKGVACFPEDETPILWDDLSYKNPLLWVRINRDYIM